MRFTAAMITPPVGGVAAVRALASRTGREVSDMSDLGASSLFSSETESVMATPRKPRPANATVPVGNTVPDGFDVFAAIAADRTDAAAAAMVATLPTGRDAIAARLTAYATDATIAGVAAGRDLHALVDGVTVADFQSEVIDRIGALRIGRVLPAVDRITVVKTLRAETRVGGQVPVKMVAAALGVSTGTVSTDANFDDADGTKPTAVPKTLDRALADIVADLKKATAKIEGAPTEEIKIQLDLIAIEIRRALATGATGSGRA